MSMTLAVHSYADAPVIVEGPGDIQQIQSQEYTMTCKAKGVPDPKYEFFKVSECGSFTLYIECKERSLSFCALTRLIGTA